MVALFRAQILMGRIEGGLKATSGARCFAIWQRGAVGLTPREHMLQFHHGGQSVFGQAERHPEGVRGRLLFLPDDLTAIGALAIEKMGNLTRRQTTAGLHAQPFRELGMKIPTQGRDGAAVITFAAGLFRSKGQRWRIRRVPGPGQRSQRIISAGETRGDKRPRRTYCHILFLRDIKIKPAGGFTQPFHFFR